MKGAEIDATGRLRGLRVVALVVNSVGHDARVIKEADSLLGAGGNVAILGMKDSLNLEDGFEVGSGVPVRLLPWRAAAYSSLARLTAWSLPLVIGLYLLLIRAADYLGVQVLGIVMLTLVWLVVVARQADAARRWAELEYATRPPERASWLRMLAGVLSPARAREHAQRIWADRVRRKQFLTGLEPLAPDVVHCHDPQTLAAGVRFKKDHGCLLVFDSHEFFEEISGMSRLARRRVSRLVRRSARYVDLFITVNESIAEEILRTYPRLPRAVVVKNAARRSEEDFGYDGRLHEAAGLDGGESILLYQGGFSKGRGLKELVRAAGLLPDRWHLVMMGWGPLQVELERMAAVGPSRSRVSFIPGAPQEELPLWTAGATVGVIPYERVSLNNWFCTPNKLWEYPLAGVPILASPFPEMRAVIEGAHIGWLLPEEMPTAAGIAKAIESLSPEEIEEARAACAGFIAEDNWSVHEDRLVTAYEQLRES